MKLTKKQRLERALYRWTDTADIVEDDIISFIEEHNIEKQQIAKDVDSMKSKFKYLEMIIKEF